MEQKQRKIETVLFDMDGTLLDSLDGLMASTNAALIRCGYPPRTRGEIRAFVGNGVGKLIERALPGGPREPGLRRLPGRFQGGLQNRHVHRHPPPIRA